MFNKYFDLSFKTVGIILLTGLTFVIAHFLFSVASVILEAFPQLLRHILVYGLSYAASIVCLWKISELQGRGLEQDRSFDLKTQATGTCIGLVLDAVLLIVSAIIPTVGPVFFKLHGYGMFPGFIFENYGSVDHSSALFIGVLVNIPIFAAVRIFGLICGRDTSIRHREGVEELARQNSMGFSNSKTGRSWKESVGNSTANRTAFLKTKKNKK